MTLFNTRQILKVRLSFADRDNLLEAMRDLSEDVVDVEHLLGMVGDWARTIKPLFGFEHVLLRNLTDRCHFLLLYCHGNRALFCVVTMDALHRVNTHLLSVQKKATNSARKKI